MSLIRPQVLIIVFVAFIMLISVTASTFASDLSSVTVSASSLVPGQEARYTIKFHVDTELDLSKGTRLTVSFSPGFTIKQNDIQAADPGCTLARLEYKNPGERFCAVAYGATSVKKVQDGIQCSFIPQPEQLVIPANTDLYWIIPGIIPPSSVGLNGLKVVIHDAHGTDYYGAGAFSLGVPPATVPSNLRLVEDSSYKVQLAWEPVPEAKRYRVIFATQPDGQFINALDLSKEPSPGEEWQLTETAHSFSGRGNGGLTPGQTYYFKVQAGNEFGFGPASPVLAVKLPDIKLVTSYPRDKEPGIAVLPPGNHLTATVDKPVKIINEQAIRIYEKSSGIRVRQVGITVEEAKGNIVNINANLRPGTEYLVAFYEGALASQGNPLICNQTFGWTFITAAASQGGKL
ncbi:Fibronectin type III domain protein [Sporomusa ovata DSM 2662]|uniref:Fibronectin type-III domain-containing protein n=1 Tax=Sporomusa ovata TaxID=2378 RepID=A0A0U1L485_9FIRM|nr:fibronectin type III domain-containing protein [Sporomusa ovata]EQB25138.1 hypothetical protein SOV_5c02880 [Sporomusa ovata DSM 2662]CQR73694.1 hypothetical protein SpAn4DRAFT_0156 [Sporomusa ovata]